MSLCVWIKIRILYNKFANYLIMSIKRHCSTCISSKISNDLDEKDKESLYNYCNPFLYKKNDVIFRQNLPSDYIIYIDEGLIKIVKEIRFQTQIIFKILKGPVFVGISSVFGNKTFNYSAYAINETKICLIDKKWFAETMEHNGKFAKRILEINCIEATNSTNRLLTLMRKQVPGRMADMLLFFSKDIFQANEFDLPLSRDEMADFIGVSKKSFIRTLGEFKHDKLISVEGKKIKIVREDLIEMLSKIG